MIKNGINERLKMVFLLSATLKCIHTCHAINFRSGQWLWKMGGRLKICSTVTP